MRAVRAIMAIEARGSTDLCEGWLRGCEQIPEMIATEVGEALEVTVRGAQLRVGPAGVVKVSPLAPFPTRRDGDDWVIEVGDLASLQELDLAWPAFGRRTAGTSAEVLGGGGPATRMAAPDRWGPYWVLTMLPPTPGAGLARPRKSWFGSAKSDNLIV